jgi:hypothetical protein
MFLRRIAPPLATVLLLLAGACSNSLSRSKAEQLIAASLGDRHDDIPLGLYSVGQDVSEDPKIKALRDAGFLTITMEVLKCADGSSCVKTSRLALTSKGEAFIAGDGKVPFVYQGASAPPPPEAVMMKIAAVVFGSVTGITESEGGVVAQVEYTLVHQPTAFGAAVGQTPVTEPGKAIFRRFDDGWRRI